MSADSLKLYEALEHAKGEPKQVARAISDFIHDDASLATKADIAELRAATKADIAELRTATKADIAELRAATKADIAALRTVTGADIAALRAATKADIAALELRLIKWLVGTVAGSALASTIALIGV